MKKRSKLIMLGIIAVILFVAGWLYLVKGYVSVKGCNPVLSNLVYKVRALGFEDVRVMMAGLSLYHLK